MLGLGPLPGQEEKEKRDLSWSDVGKGIMGGLNVVGEVYEAGDKAVGIHKPMEAVSDKLAEIPVIGGATSFVWDVVRPDFLDVAAFSGGPITGGGQYLASLPAGVARASAKRLAKDPKVLERSIDGILNNRRLKDWGSEKWKITDADVDEVLSMGDDVVFPPGSKEEYIQQTTQAFAAKRTGGYTRGADDIDVDAIGLDGLNETFNKSNLGYDPTKLSTTPYKTRVKAQDGTVMPTDIATVYVRNAEAFLKANPGKTLEDFPNMWWHGEPWVIQPRKFYKTVNGERVLDKTKIGIDSWIKRKGRKKLAQTKRTQRLKEQSEGVKKGTAAYEKVRQLRERNAKRVAAGLEPKRLRDTDLDHVNALRSVDYYTEGMPENLKQLIYEDLGREGLFTGDHATNLKLREREVHRSLWPELKSRLNKLGHKHTGFESPEARYKYYKEVNPKTGVTRLEEYAEVVYAVEELGDDMMEELLTVAKQKKQLGKPKVSPSDPVKDALIKILGSEEDYKVFMDRLREYPEKMRRDFILEEIKYNE